MLKHIKGLNYRFYINKTFKNFELYIKNCILTIKIVQIKFKPELIFINLKKVIKSYKKPFYRSVKRPFLPNTPEDRPKIYYHRRKFKFIT